MIPPANGNASTGTGWKVMLTAALTWTIISAFLILTIHKADDCSSKWRLFQTRMSSALDDLDTLKDQTRDLRLTLIEISKMQVLESLVDSRRKFFNDFLMKIRPSDIEKTKQSINTIADDASLKYETNSGKSK